jgi:multidrug efflux pump subunit AcrA (membrane-fusion protein)
LDIKREPPKKTKKIVGLSLGLVAIVAVTVAISRLRPAAPPVERGTLWIDTVKRGSMTRDVNAPGTLEPEYVRNVVALTSGRVEELPVQPGISVTSKTLLVVLENPDVQPVAAGSAGAQRVHLGFDRQDVAAPADSRAAGRDQHADAVQHGTRNSAMQFAGQSAICRRRSTSRSRRTPPTRRLRPDIEKKRLEEMETTGNRSISQQQQIEGLRRSSTIENRVESMRHLWRLACPDARQSPLELGQHVNGNHARSRR